MIRKEPGSGSSSFIQGLFYAAFILMVVPGSLWAQNELNVIQGSSSNNSWHHFDNASNFLYDHLAGQAYDLLDNRMAEISGLRSLSDWQGRQQEVRETLRDIMGPFPEKTPLNARILRTIEKDGYRVEHIVFESQPKFYVTATLFIPDGLRERAPAVLYLSGHTQNGYRSETYQHKMLNLVRKGFIVFAIDPVGQGERMGYIEPETGRSLISSSTREHSYAGVQAFITKSSLARYMTWDGIRAVDYLLSREEVDPDRLGLTGRSGGGTQSSYIAAMDERIYAAAPEAYITTFTRILQSIGPQDLEQNLYHGIARGIDHADLLAVRAPKPALMITTTEDFFSIQGARESARELSALYGAYGQAGQFKMVEDGGSHQSTPQNREAMYAFFQKHLDNPGDPRDEDVELLSEAEIQVTPTGQVATSLGGETVFSLNRREAERRMETLHRLRNDPDGYVPEMLEAARDLSGYQDPAETADPVFTGRIRRNGYVVEKYFIKGEGDYVLPYLLMVPDNPGNKALIYLHPSGKAEEASEEGEMEWFVRNGFTVMAPDLIGTGETGSDGIANYSLQMMDFAPTSYDVWTASVLIGRSITGIRAGDVVGLARMLKKDPAIRDVYGLARQGMAPVLLHAAAFDASFSRIALIEPYASYRSIVMNKIYDPGFHLSAVAGALGTYDLPDLAATLAPKSLLMANVTDGDGMTGNSDGVEEDMDVIRSAYRLRDEEGKLMIIDSGETLTFPDLYGDWLK